ncbi:SDR family NAD(P)-dependent oxidoreductase [Gordonia hydrophobica]|uniref:SDR family oxidoreductase n=1 Tax=Gordonia hydrophobica TaxID=40516 RepID=A0ABZ2U2J2_9ACTN|nr:SDR family oxidoreductase [Gordonia hydrophobica]MBM7369045.1 NAD(P)-dependent dehydrogenase (short-subunit alcohol dehydrogenase family) [Gordonia hydrophobica]
MSSTNSAGRLAGKIAVVTGGSRGVGEAVVQRFLTEGADVVAVSRSGVSSSDGAVSVQGDVSSEADVIALMNTVRERFGKLDVLVNNAAVEYEATIEHTSVDDWDRVMAINVRGPFLTAKHALPLMREAGGGSIVNLASVDGFWAEPHLAVYNTSKGAVQAFTRALAIDHGRENIRANAICPSYVLTDMLSQFFDAQHDPDEARAQAASIHPLNRMSYPADIANLALWLASDESSFATGQSYVLDGGLTAGRTVDLSRLRPEGQHS